MDGAAEADALLGRDHRIREWIRKGGSKRKGLANKVERRWKL